MGTTEAFELACFVRNWTRDEPTFDADSGWTVVNVEWGVSFSALRWPG